MRAILALVLLLATTPPVLADDVCQGITAVGDVCAREYNTADPCEDAGFAWHATEVSADTAAGSAAARGQALCYGTGGEEGIYVWTPAGSAQWTEFWYSDPENGEFRQCYVAASVGVFQDTQDVCPPNPGWGALLP